MSATAVSRDSLRWLRRVAVVAWLAWAASYALALYHGLARDMHPHFLPLTLLLLAGFGAGLWAIALGLWRLVRGPRRLAAAEWMSLAAIPGLLWLAHAAYALSTIRGPTLVRPFDYRLKTACFAASALADGLARWHYPNRLEGKHVVMIYDACDDPEADVAAMDAHIERVGAALGRPLPTTVYWVRGPLAGIDGMSVFGTAISRLDYTSRSKTPGLTHVDRHETAHNVLGDQLPLSASPPQAFIEGWAESQSGGNDRALDLWEMRQHGRALSLPQLFSPEWYASGRGAVYHEGGLLVDFLLRRYGGEKFFQLCAACRPESIADDVHAVYGIGLEELDQLFWEDVHDRAFDGLATPPANIAADLGLKVDGADDPSAREEFSRRYPVEVEQLKEAYRHVRMSATGESREVGKPDAAPRTTTTELARDGDRIRATCVDREGVHVYVATPQRCFWLDKRSTETRFRTLLLATSPEEQDNTLWRIQAYAPQSCIPYEFRGRFIQSFLQSPRSITRVVRAHEGTPRLVRVYCERAFPGVEKPCLQAACFSFRIDECWTLDSIEVRSQGLSASISDLPEAQRRELGALRVFQARVHYRGSHNGIPVLESVELKSSTAGKPPGESTIRIKDIQFGPSPDETFDLASFDADPPRERPGQPEPGEDIFTRLTGWLLWALWSCAGMVGLAASASLVHRVRAGQRGKQEAEAAP